MSLTCISPPVVQAVDLTELKEMLRVSPGDNSQDNVLNSLNIAAQNWCEDLCARRFVQQTWKLGADFFPGYFSAAASGSSNTSAAFLSGSSALLAGIRYAFVLPYPPTQSIVSFTYLGSNDGSAISITPDQYVLDNSSEPCRLSPLFGQMWPVSRLVLEAVQLAFQCGYATPVKVSTDGSSTLLGIATSFTQTNVGQPISIPGAGANSGVLNTIIASVSDAGAATLRDATLSAVGSTTALLVTNGSPGNWELAKLGIKFLVNSWYVNRTPSFDEKTRDCVKAVLSPVRDLRF